MVRGLAMVGGCVVVEAGCVWSFAAEVKLRDATRI
jgi:hypothetical protein